MDCENIKILHIDVYFLFLLVCIIPKRKCKRYFSLPNASTVHKHDLGKGIAIKTG